MEYVDVFAELIGLPALGIGLWMVLYGNLGAVPDRYSRDDLIGLRKCSQRGLILTIIGAAILFVRSIIS